MSTGGIFQLVSNDGRLDQLLLANQLLRDNIASVKSRRAAAGEADTNPTLADLERSHVLYVSAHYKPYVAIAFQYFKVSANNVTLGSEVSISIPQYGDFFADMVANVVIRAPKTSFTGAGVAKSDRVLFRHCDFPGERLFDEVRFEVNSNPIDSYTSEAYVLHRQFHIPEDKMVAWKRCMGQEIPSQATSALNADTTVDKYYAAAHTRPQVWDGLQTFKESHEDLNLWIPLLFWFNTDVRLAFPSVSVPYGQRFMTFRLTAAENLYYAIINPAANSAITNPTLSTPQISTFDLYINNMFVLPEVHDIFIDRVAFTLVRVFRRQTQNCNKSSDSIHLVQLKWPIETIMFGFQPTVNRKAVDMSLREVRQDNSAVVSGHMEDWHRFSRVVNTTVAKDSIRGAVTDLNVKRTAGHITTLQLQAHSVDLFSQFPAQFFNSYIPYQFGGSKITAPTDPGLYMYSFALQPGTYQPSGHFNVSRARELYLNYTSSFIASDSDHTATFFLQAKAINFLLISEGSCSLRYST